MTCPWRWSTASGGAPARSNPEVEGVANYFVRGPDGGGPGVLVHNGCGETIVRRLSPAEADAMVEAGGLVPKPGSRGAKWVSEGSPQATFRKKGHERTVTMEVEPGTTQWLRDQAVDFEMHPGGEASLPGGVFTKPNEPGALGVGVDLLPEFNGRVKSVRVE